MGRPERALSAAVAATLLMLLAGCQMAGEHGDTPPAPLSSAAEQVLVEPRAQLLPTYPCSSCHKDRAPDPKRRLLKEFHKTRYEEFLHGDDEFWCYQCHALDNLDRLRLANGQIVSFDEAPALCTSCHGDKLSDWKKGIHGLAAGEWNGVKYKRSCTACHNPHNPRFQAMEPEKPPQRPRGAGKDR
jgi:hypothetical protein